MRHFINEQCVQKVKELLQQAHDFSVTSRP